jgi:hypothetical protein
VVASGHHSTLSKRSDNFLHVSCTYPSQQSNKPQLNISAATDKTVASSPRSLSSLHPNIQDSPGGLFFLNPPFDDFKTAFSKAFERNVPVFTVIYDNDHPSKSKLTHSLGYFMEYQTTKKLVDEYFVTAVVPVHQADIRKLIPKDDPLENCRLVVIRADGHVLYSEGVYANPDEGLKRVRAIIDQWKLSGDVRKEAR